MYFDAAKLYRLLSSGLNDFTHRLHCAGTLCRERKFLFNFYEVLNARGNTMHEASLCPRASLRIRRAPCGVSVYRSITDISMFIKSCLDAFQDLRNTKDTEIHNGHEGSLRSIRVTTRNLQRKKSLCPFCAASCSS